MIPRNGASSLELAEHPEPAEPGAADHQVDVRQVQFGRDRERRVARVVDPLELLAHPLASEANVSERAGSTNGAR